MPFVKDLFSNPKAPDPNKQVQAQQQLNQQTQQMNMDAATKAQQANLDAARKAQEMSLAASRTNQETPYGSLYYSQTGVDANGNPTYTAKSQLSPQQQAILDQLQQNQLQAGGAAGNLIGNYGETPDFSNAASSLTSQMLDRQLEYLDPYFNQRLERLDNQLRNQGLAPGTPAYDRAMMTLRQEQDRSVGAFLNTAQSQAFDQATKQYNIPLDTISRLLGLSQPANLAGSFTNTPQANVAAPNMTAPTATAPNFISADQTAYDNAMKAYTSAWSGVGGIGAAVLGAPGGSLGGNIGAGLSNMIGLPQTQAPARA